MRSYKPTGTVYFIVNLALCTILLFQTKKNGAILLNEINGCTIFSKSSSISFAYSVGGTMPNTLAHRQFSDTPFISSISVCTVCVQQPLTACMSG